MQDKTTKCPMCGGRDGDIKRRKSGLLYFECVSPCNFQGPSGGSVDQAMAAARRVAFKRKQEIAA